jgi:DNA sulfur modification protein DndC
MEARRWMLEQILGIQAEVNREAIAQNRPEISLINEEELARIKELMAANTWPDKWDGTEARGDMMFSEIFPDGSVQELLFDEYSF